MEAYLKSASRDVETLRTMHPQGHRHRRLRSRHLRLVVQEQGRAADAGRRRRLPALPERREAIKIVDENGKAIGDARRSDEAPCARAGVQGHQRPVRHADLRPRLFGRDQEGRHVLNFTRGKRERIGRMVEMYAKDTNGSTSPRGRHLRLRLDGGDGDRRHAVRSGQPGHAGAHEFPDPVISVSVEPKAKGDRRSSVPHSARWCGPTRRCAWRVDKETGQTILRGMGELHLEVTIDRMRTEFGVEGRHGRSAGGYRETITRKVEHIYTHKKQTGGSGQFAEVKMIFEPLERGEASSSSTRSSAARSRANTSRPSAAASSPEGRWRARRLPDRGLQGHSDRRQVPRRRLQRAGIRNRGQGLLP